MRFLLLNQTFYPDVASTAQHLSDLALGLAERGHDVTVLTSRRAYDHPEKLFPKTESWRGIRIIRIDSTGFGKGARWRRAADFASFLALCSLRLAFIPRHDTIVALTSPPLISFLAACTAKVRRCRFFYWVMDFNPDEAIAAGWLQPNSVATRLLERMSRFSLNSATRIIALDRFMRDRIAVKNIPADKILVIPPWAHDSEVRFDRDGRERFRKAHGLDGKFVVMYSGNHSPCHPLDTLLEAARTLADDPGILFCFIGGGSEWRRIKEKAESTKQKAEIQTPDDLRPLTSDPRASCSPLPAPLSSIASATEERSPHLLCIPYQPLSELSGSLSAADLHVVVMGEPFVGLVHPCKIYNILTVAAPVLYIGPRPSHLSELMDSLNGEYTCASAAHGEVQQVVEQIRKVRDQSLQLKRESPARVLSHFSKQTVLQRLIGQLEAV